MIDRFVPIATRLALHALALTTFVAAAAGAQQSAPAAYRGVVGFNPLGIPFNVFSAEVEGAVAQGFTIAGVGSYTDFGGDDDRYTSFELKGRYYPQEIALSGFSLGVGMGILNFSGVFYRPSTSPTGPPERVRHSHTSPTVSIAADYNWLLGSQRRFLVGGGIGAKRVLSRGDNQELDVPRAYPTARFIVGLAF